VKKKMMLLLMMTVMVSGCATMQRDQSMVSQLQLRIGELERAAQNKDRRIADLETEVKDLSYDLEQVKKAPVSRRAASVPSVSSGTPAVDDDRIVRVDVDPKTVQQALKNAGYYSGAIDGKVGSGTKKAIYQFQQDKGLTADGLIGRQTWAVLKTFL